MADVNFFHFGSSSNPNSGPFYFVFWIFFSVFLSRIKHSKGLLGFETILKGQFLDDFEVFC